MPGFGPYLPDEFREVGQADVPAMVEDFITFRQHVESGDGQGSPSGPLSHKSLPIWPPTHKDYVPEEEPQPQEADDNASKASSSNHSTTHAVSSKPPPRRRLGRRRSSVRLIPLSKSHVKEPTQVVVHHDNNNDNSLPKTCLLQPTTTVTSPAVPGCTRKTSITTGKIPITSWSAMKTPWEDSTNRSYDEEEEIEFNADPSFRCDEQDELDLLQNSGNATGEF